MMLDDPDPSGGADRARGERAEAGFGVVGYAAERRSQTEAGARSLRFTRLIK